MDSKPTDLVAKANILVEASYRLDLVEQRLILAAIVEARESQTGLGGGHVTIQAAQFAETFGMGEGTVYAQLKDALKSLYRRSVTIHDIDPESGKPRVSDVRWISRASYIDGLGAVQLRFSQDMVPYITRMSEEGQFTRYRLERIGKLTSTHAVRVYELLVQYLSIGLRYFDISDLKAILGLTGEYPAIKDFKRWVIDPAVKQINAHTDITVSYENRKLGRTVTGLVFTIKTKESENQKAKKAKAPALTREYVQKHARTGESWDEAYRRLAEDQGQQRLPV